MTITEQVNIPVNAAGLASAASSSDALGAALANVAKRARTMADAVAEASAAGLTDAGTGDAAVIASARQAQAAEAALAAHRASAGAAAAEAAALAKAATATGRLKSAATAAGGAIKSAAKAAAGITFKAAIASASKLGSALKQIGIGALRQAGAKSFDLLGDAIGAVTGNVIALDHAKRSLDQVTGGRGAAALAQLQSVSNGLGQSISDTTEQFVKLRKDGLNNIDATKAIKLRADLIAVGASAEDADKEVDKLNKEIKEGKDADKSIKKIADAYGAVGDGSNAAAKAAFTLEGALQSLRAKADALGATIATAVGGSVIKALGSIEGAVTKITLKLGPSVSTLINAVGVTVDMVAASGELDNAIGALIPTFQLLTALAVALGPVTRVALTIATGSVGMLNKAIGAIVPLVYRTIGALSAYAPLIQYAIENPAKAAALAWQFAVVQIVAAMGAIGAAAQGSLAALPAIGQAIGLQFVASFAAGIASGQGLAAAAGAAAGTAAQGGLRSANEQNSPSKVAQRLGGGFKRDYLDAIAIDDTEAAGAFAAPSAGPGPAANSNAGGGKNYTITVNAGDSAKEIVYELESMIRRLG